jgi:hypothetical protein
LNDARDPTRRLPSISARPFPIRPQTNQLATGFLEESITVRNESPNNFSSQITHNPHGALAPQLAPSQAKQGRPVEDSVHHDHDRSLVYGLYHDYRDDYDDRCHHARSQHLGGASPSCQEDVRQGEGADEGVCVRGGIRPVQRT